MSANEPIIMNGRAFAAEYSEKVLKPRCSSFNYEYGHVPALSTIMIGENPSSESYIRMNTQFLTKLGLLSKVTRLPEDITESRLLKFIDEQNCDESITGIIVQLPLPKHLDTETIIEKIDPMKDVEGLTPRNVYLWAKDIPNMVPCTALGVIALLKYYQVPLEGKHAVVIGRSMIVGKPVNHLLLKENATVTVCHSRTPAIEYFTKQADIIIAAVGKPLLINETMVRKNTVVVDVGVNWLEKEKKLVGDVDFEHVKSLCSYISPVPGGTGPVTVSMLASNLLLSFELQHAENNKTIIKCLRKYYSTFNNLDQLAFECEILKHPNMNCSTFE